MSRAIRFLQHPIPSRQSPSWIRRDPYVRRLSKKSALVNSYVRVLDQIELEESSLQKPLSQLSYDNQQIRLLMTLPGVGPAAAQVLYAALGDWKRFKDGAHAASYLGLSPSTRQSASHCFNGSITKAGNSLARWLLTQAARQVAHHPDPLGVFFRRIHKRKNFNIAVVATARKLITIGYLMLKNAEPLPLQLAWSYPAEALGLPGGSNW